MTWLADEAVARLRNTAMRPDLASDRYELGELIGRGGMGSVYAAKDHLLGREVAIKIAHTVIGADVRDAGVDAESRILSKLEHPGIVPIHDAGVTADGRVFYAMKRVRGETLTAHIAGVPDLSARLPIFAKLVEAVAFAHAAGVVHRDLSPANVMIGGFGEVLVLDWGFSEIMTAAGAGRDDLRVGTRGFLAPEHVSTGAVSARPTADVFSLGAILSLLLSGVTAPKRLRAIADKCQLVDPAFRYANAAELAADLERFRAGKPVTAYRDTIADHAIAWLGRYGVFVALVLAYLAMRAAVALLAGR